jgi:hypothetical protein
MRLSLLCVIVGVGKFVSSGGELPLSFRFLEKMSKRDFEGMERLLYTPLVGKLERECLSV